MKYFSSAVWLTVVKFVQRTLTSPSSSSCSSSRIFLSILGFGLSIMFCTTFCRACSRLREEAIEREAWRRSEQDGHPPSIYFIPFPGGRSRRDSEDHLRAPRYSQELQSPPRYSMAGYCGPPPSYNEVILKQNNNSTIPNPSMCCFLLTLCFFLSISAGIEAWWSSPFLHRI